MDDSHAEMAQERISIATATRAFTRAANDPDATVRPRARVGLATYYPADGPRQVTDVDRGSRR